MKWTKKAAFINRIDELNFLKRWVSQQPENVLFLFGPKSSGKTTLINHFMATFVNVGEWDVKHFNLREILITNYTDFLQTFFEMDYSKGKEELREKREYNLKVFKLTVETLKGLRNKELDPFVVMKRELLKLASREIKSLIIIDELQALEGVYMDGQRELIQELFNFFVAITKESHLCHVLICSSDGYFIERIYSDSKLTKACRMYEVDYLRKDDVVYWLNHLKEESGIDNLILTPSQIETIWHYFGGSVWEISNFLSTLMIGASHNWVEDSVLEDEANKEVLAWKNRFHDYLGKYYDYDLFSVIHAILLKPGTFHEKDLVDQFDRARLKEELGNLVRHNFFSYNPVTGEYKPQGPVVALGLEAFCREF